MDGVILTPAPQVINALRASRTEDMTASKIT